MKKIIVNGKEMHVDENATLAQIAAGLDVIHPYLAAKQCNRLLELYREPDNCDEVEFVDLTDVEGYRIYQRSLVFVMIYAARKVLGDDIKVVVEHSINKNYYCEIFRDGLVLDEGKLAQIKAEMAAVVASDVPITKHTLRLEEAQEIARKMNLPDKERLLKYRTTSLVNFYKLDEFYDYFYGPMVVSTGVLKKFDLLLSGKGFMFIFPDRKNPENFSKLRDVAKLTEVFRESNAWARILEIDTVGALNDKICNGQAGDVIRISEALHEKNVAKTADQILHEGRKVALIAGPTSSGKTTFSHRLAIQLQVNGLRPRVIGLDDYYINRDQTPLDEFGKPDFESIRAIDVVQFNYDLQRLIAGEQVEMPKYNFLTGQREYKGNFMRLDEDDVLVIEGLHGLNPQLAEGIADDKKFKIFISALTQLNMDSHNRIGAADTRKIRRLVRDNQFRGFDAKRTIDMWPSVVRGELENIFPFQDSADVIFNSALVYELCVLKIHAMPLLFRITQDDPAFIEASRLIKFLDGFMGIVENEVPINSLLREFIGGSCFKK